MSGIYIPNMIKPQACADCPMSGFVDVEPGYAALGCNILKQIVTYPIDEDCPLVPVPPHGRLIDADVLRAKMYHEAFETDNPMQKWDSGCWILYKMFRQMEEAAPTIIPAEEGEA